MKVGDLVKSPSHPHLGLGLITNKAVEGDGYVWVAFAGWTENDKWCRVAGLELISEAR